MPELQLEDSIFEIQQLKSFKIHSLTKYATVG